MLLLFWKALILRSGNPLFVRWYHASPHPPRCLFGTSGGFSIINPYINYTDKECSWVKNNQVCNALDIYDNYILAGTSENGIYKLDVNIIDFCDVENPTDYTDQLEQSYTTASGLLSDNIISIEAQNPYLGIVTTSGFCWNKNEGSFVTYMTTSGVDVFITPRSNIYLAEGQDLHLKQGEPSDFSVWDKTWQFNNTITNVWVSTHEGVDTVFVSTTSGVFVIRNSDIYNCTSLISGSKNIYSLAIEQDACYDQGHLFTISSGVVTIINLKTKETETAISYNGIVAFEYQRIYSK